MRSPDRAALLNKATVTHGSSRAGIPHWARQAALLEGVKAQALPLSWVIVFCIAYVLPGLTGHDPWKADEAYIFGGVYSILQTGDWVVPTVAGEPFMEKPPLFHIVAATTAKLTPMLQLHDGARLASGLFMALTLLALSWSARRDWGEGYGRHAALLLLSSLGLVIHAHMMLPDLALLAGFAVAVAGFIACAYRYPWGGFLLGLGAGMGFLAKGLLGPGVIGVAALLLPMIFREWRHQGYLWQLGLALLSALPWLTIWPTALYLRSPELFDVWFWDNNIGRFLGFSVSHLGAATEPWFWWKTYPWFLFPIWLFAATVFWKLRRDAFRKPAVQVGATVAATLALALGVSASARDLYALPMLAPLALLGAGAVGQLPRWAERALLALAIIVSASAAILFWFLWASLVRQGHAPDWPWIARTLPHEFAMPLSPTAIAVAMLLTIGMVAWTAITWRRTGRALHAWCAALVLAWGLVATLLLPWIDSAKSYRAMYQSMNPALPAGMTCLASHNLGESERAMLDYMLGMRTYREETTRSSGCNAILVQDHVTGRRASVDPTWALVWSGARPADSSERFQLYAVGGKALNMAQP